MGTRIGWLRLWYFLGVVDDRPGDFAAALATLDQTWWGERFQGQLGHHTCVAILQALATVA